MNNFELSNYKFHVIHSYKNIFLYMNVCAKKGYNFLLVYDYYVNKRVTITYVISTYSYFKPLKLS